MIEYNLKNEIVESVIETFDYFLEVRKNDEMMSIEDVEHNIIVAVENYNDSRIGKDKQYLCDELKEGLTEFLMKELKSIDSNVVNW